MTCLIYDEIGQLLDIKQFNNAKEKENFKQQHSSWTILPSTGIEEAFLISEFGDVEEAWL